MKETSRRLKWLSLVAALVVVGAVGCSSDDSSSSSQGTGGASGSGGSLGTGGQGATVRDGSTQDASDGSPRDAVAADASVDGSGSDGSSRDGGSADVASNDVQSDASPFDASVGEAATADGTADAGNANIGDAADGEPSDTTAPPNGPGLINARTVPVTASTPLAVNAGSTLPANGAIEVPGDTLLRLGFDAPPVLGVAGAIAIHRVSDDAIVDAINVADPYAIYDGTTARLTTNQTSSKVNVIGGLTSGIDQVRVVNYIPIMIAGNTATIFPHNNKLSYATSYYVTIDDGAFAGAIAGTAFTGVSSTTAWVFTTKAAPPATLTVAADNTADFATVQGAIDAIAPGSSANVIVDIAPGVYQELLFIRNKKNITLRGSNNGIDTVIQYDNCDGFNPGVGGGQAVTTPGATGTIPGYGAPADNLVAGGRPVLLTTSATGIVLDSITIKNLHPQGSRTVATLPAPTAIPAAATASTTFVNYNSAVTQAETLYFNTSFTNVTPAGWLVAKHSNFISYQDTIELKGFSWFYDSFITGDTDFIWGNANAALFEQCEIKSRFNANGSSVVQSRAYLGFGTTNTPADFNTSYPGFVFLNSALTKEPGTFTAYLARSPGAATVSGAAAPFYYLQYDIVSYIGCTMDSHIAAVGWNVAGGNPTGANVRPNAVVGWREFGSLTPAGQPLDVSQRLVDPSPAGTVANPGGSIQLAPANVTTFFADRATILHGATDGTFTTTGLPTFTPLP